jgi:tRNA N6-adenosine threonylcarbamoyltransferase
MSHALKHFEQVALGFEPHYALPELAPTQNLRRQVLGDYDPLAGAHLFTGPDQRFPSICSKLAGQKNLDPPRAMFPPPIEPGRKNARVIEHQAIVLMHIGGEIPEVAILPGALRAIDHQHPRAVAFRERLLGDQLFGQIIIEVINTHSSRLILGIESSCDETAAAVVENGTVILSSVIASQMETHAKYGGVVPELASREHLRAIVPAVRQALEQSGTTRLDAIAVTEGPGLIGSLLVGITYAKAMAMARALPLIAVNHIEGHIYAVESQNAVELPALALVVSGGHTHLYEVNAEHRYRLLGKTRDDAAGEAFDKVGKLLGFGYPGGPVIDKLAAHGNPDAVKFTTPKMKGNTLDFSFSGIKTAVLRWVEARDMTSEIAARRESGAVTAEEWLAVTPHATLDLIASFQRTVVDELLRRAIRAAEEIDASSIIISGGVACNSGLQAAAKKGRLPCPAYFPTLGLATDNAAMIAAAAFPKFARGEFADLGLRPQPNLVLA